MKNLFTFCFLLLSFCCIAQTSDRVEINGHITVPSGFEAEGITIYNQTASRGTVSSEKGNFRLPMKVGDSLVFSAVQFRELKIEINQEIIDAGVLTVGITEGVNELPEIVIKPHSLTGNMLEYIKNIEVTEIDIPSMSFGNIKDLDFAPDSQSATQNAVVKGSLQNGLNVGGLLGLLGKAILPKKNEKLDFQPTTIPIDRELRNRYSNDFFNSTLSIEDRDINDFIAFAQENGLSRYFLKKEKEMDLLQLLIEQSELFRKSR